MSQTLTLSTYASLRSQVRAAINAGKHRAQDAVEAEKVRTAWEIGRLIYEHILLNKDRANYGEQVIKRLSGDFQISQSELGRMVEFARAYPISAAPRKLSWAHYRELLAINNHEKREEITGQAVQNKWSQKELRREIGKLKIPNSLNFPTETLLKPKQGKLNTYQIVMAKLGPFRGLPVVDLGFSNYLSLDVLLSRRWPQESRKGRRGATTFKEGDIIYSGRDAKGELVLLKNATEADLFTYRVYLDEVTDADTLWVLVDLGFGFTTKQQLRLRGIDAPEITTREGQKAKRFVERQLKSASQIIITSTKSDKYDRYLADVFYVSKGQEKFLNNELLNRRFAERVP